MAEPRGRGTGADVNTLTSADLLTQMKVPGLTGHWHRMLELPHGYQHFDWYQPGDNPNGVYLNDPVGLAEALSVSDEEAYLYTHHEIFYEEGIIKHTRSSPNWEGGLVTYATCKHLMRTYREDWVGTWLIGLCPKECEGNTVLFGGQVKYQLDSNHALGLFVQETYAPGEAKQALHNPRGDLYTPVYETVDPHDHTYFQEPPGHTRSVEMYRKSPGSTSDRPDGKVPKWWRDLEYLCRGKRPPSFVLDPCYLFSRPTLWHQLQPRRAVLRLQASEAADGLTLAPPNRG